MNHAAKLAATSAAQAIALWVRVIGFAALFGSEACCGPATLP